MSDKKDCVVVADFDILMDYYKGNADCLTPQPVIRDVDVVFKGKYNTLALGVVSLKFINVSEGCIELRVLSKWGDRFTILFFRGDKETTLTITY